MAVGSVGEDQTLEVTLPPIHADASLEHRCLVHGNIEPSHIVFDHVTDLYLSGGVRGRSTRHKPGDRSCTCAMHLRHALLHAQELGQLIDNELARLFGSRKSDLGPSAKKHRSRRMELW